MTHFWEFSNSGPNLSKFHFFNKILIQFLLSQLSLLNNYSCASIFYFQVTSKVVLKSKMTYFWEFINSELKLCNFHFFYQNFDPILPSQLWTLSARFPLERINLRSESPKPASRSLRLTTTTTENRDRQPLCYFLLN